MKAKSFAIGDKQMRLLEEAAEWRLLGLLFECPVGDWKDQVSVLSETVNDSGLKLAAQFALTEADEGTYHSIFGPGGPAPPREVTYRSWVQPGYLLSELSAFYKAFAYTPKTHEVADHISVETGFIAYLRLKEAYALECGASAQAALARKAAKTFIAGHLSKVTEPIMKSLAFSGVEYLALASVALLKRVGQDKDKKVRQVLPVFNDTENTMFDCG